MATRKIMGNRKTVRLTSKRKSNSQHVSGYHRGGPRAADVSDYDRSKAPALTRPYHQVRWKYSYNRKMKVDKYGRIVPVHERVRTKS